MQLLLDRGSAQNHSAFSTTQRMKSVLSRASEIMINHDLDCGLKLVFIMPCVCV